MKQLYFVYQVSYFKPLLLRLENCGLDVASTIRKSEIRHFDLSNSKNYIPTGVVHDFLVALKKECKIDSFVDYLSCGFCLSELGSFGTYIKGQPTLKKAISEFVKFSNILQTNLKTDLRIHKDIVVFSFSFLEKCSHGSRISENIILVILCQLFKMYLGNNWNPITIYIPNTAISDIKSLSPRGKYFVQNNRSEYKFVFSKSLLDTEVCAISLNSSIVPECQETNIINIIEQVISSYECGCIPSLKTLSIHFNTSESSMKRLLKSNQTKFSNILEEILYNRAIHLLTKSDMNINLISENLGYSDSPNFIRSFKKWTGLTPGIYREHLRVS